MADQRNTMQGLNDDINTDITGRKQAEEKLLRSEAQYHSLVENMQEGLVWVVNSKIKI